MVSQKGFRRISGLSARVEYRQVLGRFLRVQKAVKDQRCVLLVVTFTINRHFATWCEGQNRFWSALAFYATCDRDDAPCMMKLSRYCNVTINRQGFCR